LGQAGGTVLTRFRLPRSYQLLSPDYSQLAICPLAVRQMALSILVWNLRNRGGQAISVDLLTIADWKSTHVGGSRLMHGPRFVPARLPVAQMAQGVLRGAAQSCRCSRQTGFILNLAMPQDRGITRRRAIPAATAWLPLSTALLNAVIPR